MISSAKGRKSSVCVIMLRANVLGRQAAGNCCCLHAHSPPRALQREKCLVGSKCKPTNYTNHPHGSLQPKRLKYCDSDGTRSTRLRRCRSNNCTLQVAIIDVTCRYVPGKVQPACKVHNTYMATTKLPSQSVSTNTHIRFFFQKEETLKSLRMLMVDRIATGNLLCLRTQVLHQ